jgi:hypothetical protein
MNEPELQPEVAGVVNAVNAPKGEETPSTSPLPFLKSPHFHE